MCYSISYPCSVGKWKIKQTKKMINGWITKKVTGLKNDSILQWTKGRNSIMLLCQEGMVFCYQNCSDLLWEKIVLVVEKKLLGFRNMQEKLENYMYCSSFKVLVCITFYTIRWNTIMFCNPKPGKYTSRTLLLPR